MEVPNNQRSGVIFVNTVRVPAMMDAVVARGVEKQLQKTAVPRQNMSVLCWNRENWRVLLVRGRSVHGSFSLRHAM